jgi:uncharacterized membrane protein
MGILLIFVCVSRDLRLLLEVNKNELDMKIIPFLKEINTPLVKSFFFVIALFALFVILVTKKKEFNRNMKCTAGRIRAISSGFKYKCLSATCFYSYTVEGVTFHKTQSIMINIPDEYKIEEKYFPVAYDKFNPEKASMLMLPDDFHSVGLQQPDSLKWVNDIVW